MNFLRRSLSRRSGKAHKDKEGLQEALEAERLRLEEEDELGELKALADSKAERKNRKKKGKSKKKGADEDYEPVEDLENDIRRQSVRMLYDETDDLDIEDKLRARARTSIRKKSGLYGKEFRRESINWDS